MDRILPWTRFFCNVYLFRVLRSWTDSVQMKSSMTFIRGKRCIEREKDYFKSREVKRLKECALALNTIIRLEKKLNKIFSSCLSLQFKKLITNDTKHWCKKESYRRHFNTMVILAFSMTRYQCHKYLFLQTLSSI